MRFLCTLFTIAFVLISGTQYAEESSRIPVTIEECHGWLDAYLPEEAREKIRSGGDTSFLKPLAMQLRNAWWHVQSSPLRDYFLKRGITHAGGMSSVILASYQDHVRGEPSKIEELIQWQVDSDKAAQPPPSMDCPKCKGQLEEQFMEGGVSPEGRPRWIRYAYCSKERRLWAFEQGKSWYKLPKKEEEARIRDLKKIGAWSK